MDGWATMRSRHHVNRTLENCGIVGDVIHFPDDPVKWVNDLKVSLKDSDSMEIVIDTINDGGGTSTITFCTISEEPEGFPENDFTSHPGNNLSFQLSNRALRNLGKALIAAAEINDSVFTNRA